MLTVNQLQTANKGMLREAMRELGVSYAGLNVEGMRALLLATVATGVPPSNAETPENVYVAPNVLEQHYPEVAPVVHEPRVLPTLVSLVPVAEELTPVEPTTPPEPATRKIQKDRVTRNFITRPSVGTICATIWEWCDAQTAAGVVPQAKALREANPTLDPTTCTIQFYRWRKHNGIVGRVK